MADEPFSSHGAGVHLEVDGLNAMVKGFTDQMHMKRYKPLVKYYSIRLAQKTHVMMNQAYTGHYEGKKKVMPTGTTRRSTQYVLTDDGKTGIVAPGTSYFPYLEYGTRKMKARPALGPAFEIIAPQFAKAMDERFETWSHHKSF